MFRSLRGRFILSHILPLLLIVPLVGITLIYVLETQVSLSHLANELTGETVLLAELASDRTDVWYNCASAQGFVTLISQRFTVDVMLLDPRGRLLASSDPSFLDQLGQRLEIPDLSNILAGEVSVHTAYSQHRHTEIVAVAVPVLGPDGAIVGIIRLSHRLGGVYERFMHTRYLIAVILLVGLLLGAGVGWILASNLERPLRQVTRAAYQLARGERLEPLPEQGPQEVRLLLSAVNSLVERMRSLEQARRQMLSNLVHELGRPLGALRSAIEALLGGADEEEPLRRELLLGVEGEIERLRRLSDDLAGIYDRALGSFELNRQLTPLREWLLNSLGPWKEAAQAKGLHWKTTVPNTLPTLQVDPDRLGQAVGNLLSNAIKYTPSGGTVSVSAGVEGEDVWIRVSDTGPGISPEDQALIFTAFYRSQVGRRFPQGMGLGLSIARELAAAHGGRLEVASELGHGSRFTLWLPIDNDLTETNPS